MLCFPCKSHSTWKAHLQRTTKITAPTDLLWVVSHAPSNARAVDESISYLAFPARLLDAYACTAYPLFLMPGNHELDRLKQLDGWWPSLSFHKNGPHNRVSFSINYKPFQRKMGAVTFTTTLKLSVPCAAPTDTANCEQMSQGFMVTTQRDLGSTEFSSHYTGERGGKKWLPPIQTN